MKPSQPAATAGEARFCSADACSVRKDITRKTRHLLMPPATGDLQQADSLASSVGMGAATQDGVKERGGKVAGGGEGAGANDGQLPVGDATAEVVSLSNPFGSGCYEVYFDLTLPNPKPVTPWPPNRLGVTGCLQPEVSRMSTAPAAGEQGHDVTGDHKDGVEVEQQRRLMSASHFDSSNIFSIYHVRVTDRVGEQHQLGTMQNSTLARNPKKTRV